MEVPHDPFLNRPAGCFMNVTGTPQPWSIANPNSAFRTIVLACVVTILCYLAAMLGGTLVMRPQMVWPLWPGCALLVAILLLTPRKIWPVLLASGLAGFLLYDLPAGLTVRSIVLLILSDGIEVLIAALGVSYALGGIPRIDSIKSLAKYSLFAVILAPISVASIGALALGGRYWLSYRISFFTEALALLTVTPAILSWVSARLAWTEQASAYYLEAAALMAGLIVLGYITFVVSGSNTVPVLLYAMVPLLLWSALRFGIMGTSTSMIVVSSLSTWGAVHGRGPFTGLAPLHNVLSLQLFLLFAATPFMILAALGEEHKHAEQALRESEGRFRLVANTAPVMIWMSGPDKLCTYFNRPWLEFTGRPIEAELGNGWAEGVHPEDLKFCLDTYTKAFEHHESFKMQYRLRRHDGQYRWVSDIGVPRFNADGSFAGYIASSIDITERKQAEEALEKSEEKFSKAFRESPMALTLASTRDHRYLDVNETFERITGWRRQEVIGRTPFDIKLWKDPSLVEAALKELLAAGSIRNFELRVRCRDGSVKVGLASAELIEIEGEPFVLSVTADITDLKETEKKLHASEEMLAGIVRSAMDAIIAIDEEQRVVQFNTAAERMFGCTAGEAIGTTIDRFIPQWRGSGHREDIRHFGVINRAMGYLGDLRAVGANGKELPIEASISEVRIDSKKLFTAIIRDVTERKTAEGALARLNRRLIEAQEEERRRVARELHDDYQQRVALLAIDLETLAGNVENSPAAAAQRLRELWESACELGADLHDLSHSLHSSTLESLGLVAGIRAFCEEFADQQSIEIDFAHENVPPAIPGDAALCLFRIAQEGLRNVKRHSGADRAEVRLEASGETLHLSVTDRGRGFDSNSSRSGGIGIRSMEERVRLLGGNLEIQSRPLKGTRIDAWLSSKASSQRAS
jgi:PAS domain S-box-containing protein